MELTKGKIIDKIIIIRGDFQDGDYVERTMAVTTEEFNAILPFLLVIQDLYKHKDEFEFCLDIRQDIDEFIIEYFKRYENIDIRTIHQYADSWILDELSNYMPHWHFNGWSYPLELLSIHVIDLEEGSVRWFPTEQPNPWTLHPTRQFILDWLKEQATKQS